MMGQPPTTLLLAAALLLLLGASRAAAPRPNPNLKILSYYDTVFEDQKSLLTLAIAENALANQFRSVGVPSLAPLDNIAAGVWKRRHTAEGGSVLLPGWEKLVEAWVGHLQPSLDNGTTVGVFLGVSPTPPHLCPQTTPPHHPFHLCRHPHLRTGRDLLRHLGELLGGAAQPSRGEVPRAARPRQDHLSQ
eukprot:COSAG04_NODE_1541_length_6419_cov_3.373259_12_plen_190_part_00